ncbi:chloramphenicol acetyltransferase [Clostridiaceae bacterium M8S5]|nr:chloramphenicol acetyltransferase [Clostridiaceae bacterium M8S5]
MKYIDIQNWKRKKQFDFFKKMDYPHFNICANIDITNWYKYIKEKNIPFFISIVYVATRTANSIAEFKLRIRGDEVVEHDFVSPATTIMTEEGVFDFCDIEYNSNFRLFEKTAKTQINKSKKEVSLNPSQRDDLLYMTSIPWVSFTSASHPISMNPVDCIPRIAWGKYFKENKNIKLPLSVQVHHALMDGSHAGEYFTLFQGFVDKPEEILSL